MEAKLIAAESAFEENKRVLSEYKALAKLADDLLDLVMQEGGDNAHENNGLNLDEETMKELMKEAIRDITEALNEALSCGSRPADGRNGGGHDGSSGDDHSKEAGGIGGDHSK